MPKGPREQHIALGMRQCRYTVVADLEFEGLWASEGKETARIRFSRGLGTRLDLPVSAATLCALARALAPLASVPPERLPEQLVVLPIQHD